MYDKGKSTERLSGCEAYAKASLLKVESVKR